MDSTRNFATTAAVVTVVAVSLSLSLSPLFAFHTLPNVLLSYGRPLRPLPVYMFVSTACCCNTTTAMSAVLQTQRPRQLCPPRPQMQA